MSDVVKFAEYHNLTPLTLINATKLVEAQHLAKTEMTMKASQQLEFVRLQIKRCIEKLAEQYVEHFKMKNGVYTEGVNLVVKKALYQKLEEKAKKLETTPIKLIHNALVLILRD